LLDQQGNAKLTDFGIALVLGDKRLTSTGKFLGTPEYMSPEQITMPNTIDVQSDIFSMGIVLFELLTCRVPFTGETDYAICQSQVNDKVPATLE
jgi:serine/threonine protein kinase